MDEKAESYIKWLRSGGKLELWAWRKVKLARNRRAEVYEPRVYRFTLEDFYHRAEPIIELPAPTPAL